MTLIRRCACLIALAACAGAQPAIGQSRWVEIGAVGRTRTAIYPRGTVRAARGRVRVVLRLRHHVQEGMDLIERREMDCRAGRSRLLAAPEVVLSMPYLADSMAAPHRPTPTADTAWAQHAPGSFEGKELRAVCRYLRIPTATP